MKTTSNQPFYLQMTALLRNALDLLDEQGREEVVRFVNSQQNPDGGFQDRGGRSDLYYSLFGMLILKAMDVPETGNRKPVSIQKLKDFISLKSTSEVPGFIEKCCLVLLQKELNSAWYSRVSSFLSLGRSFWKERQSINLSYRSFVLFLTLDAVVPFPGLLKFGAKKMLERTIVDENSPCSEISAKVFMQKMMDQKYPADQDLLVSFACESGGFKAFSHLRHADMLSTAVALFALNYSGTDLRLLKPGCLSFIQQNFTEGAFLSGDGDQTRDVEYTFYGLLALGVMADKNLW